MLLLSFADFFKNIFFSKNSLENSCHSVRLEYRYKTDLQDSPNCRCGDPESVKHFIEDCELYNNICERLRTRLFYSCGIKDFSAKTFLEVSRDNPLNPLETASTSYLKIFFPKQKDLKNNKLIPNY